MCVDVKLKFKTTKRNQLSETTALSTFFLSAVHPQAQTSHADNGGSLEGGDAGDERIPLCCMRRGTHEHETSY